MKNQKKVIIASATVFLAAIAFLQPLRFVNNIFYDLNFAFSSQPASDSVLVIAIDEQSIQEIGAMPWPRATLAGLVEKISEAKPKTIAIDILFPRREEDPGNDSLTNVFSRTSGLVLPFRAGHISNGEIPGQFAIPNDVFNRRFMRIDNKDNLSKTGFYTAAEITTADTSFSRFAGYSGFLNVSTSVSSQKLREAIHVIKIGPEYFPSLAISALASYDQLKPDQVILDGEGYIRLNSRTIPISSYAASTHLNFQHSDSIKTIAASAILNGTADMSILTGKLVFIGVTDPAASADFFITPGKTQCPGVIVWATAVLDIMESGWITNGGGVLSAVSWLVLLLLFPGFALLIPSRLRVVSIAAGLLTLAGSVAAGIYLLQNSNYFWDPTGHFYAWLFGLIWLAAQKAVPALGGSPALILEPQDGIEQTILPPPGKEELEADFPSASSIEYVLKSVLSGSEPVKTISGTIIESSQEGTDNKPATLTASIAGDLRELAGGIILKHLGTGGMADVFLIWNPRTECYRAVKVLKPQQSEAVVSRFETEIRIFSKLNHSNIVQCHSVGDWHTLPYVEMEYVNGASMEQVLKKCTLLSIEQALAVGILVCRALHYAHNQVISIYGTTYKGIVHRDLKPANILLSRSGRIKLTDFGIARPGSVSLHTTDTGSVVGTLPYLAPEQVEGGQLTYRADIYSLGTTLYEFITGERAFPQAEIAAILSAKTAGKYKPITPSARISKEIAATIQKAMAVQPSDRYSSVAAFKNDLEKALGMLMQHNGSSPLSTLVKRMWQ